VAISWDTQISQVNVASKRASVSFTRTDSENPSDVFNVSYPQVILETIPQRMALLDQAWSAWQKELVNRSNIADFITNLEQTANSNLGAREA